MFCGTCADIRTCAATSRKVEDIRAGYLAGANSFIEKPRDYKRFRDVLEGILHYWFESALLLPP